uniref:Protein kinase domain-containing protein n=1 Tax=Quercus lobata TaxID=97700 RepID=A0A7N2MRP2_QUELO
MGLTSSCRFWVGKEEISVRGTRYFFSPEMVKSGMQEVPSDIWAVGCTVLMMLTGEPPWDTALVSDIISHVACESPPIPSYISKAAEDFLRGWLLFEESTGENDS